MYKLFISFFFLSQLLFTQTHEENYKNISEYINNSQNDKLSEALKSPIDFSFAPKGSYSLVMLAVYAKNYEAVKLFVQKGASLNSFEGGFQSTPIMHAAYNDDINMVNLLLDLGADIDKRDLSFGDPAINWAAYAGHRKMVNHLLKKGASPYFVGHGNALDIALRRGFDEMVQDLSDFMKLSLKLEGKMNSLYQAVLGNQSSKVKEILSTGINPNSLGRYNRPLLHLAASKGHLEIVKILHQYGADIDKVDRIGFTALFYASLKDQADVVNYLLNNGANVNHISNTRSLHLTPFHLAAIGQSIGSLEALASYQAKMNVKCSTGSTPFLWGLFESDSKNLDFAIKMIDLGADPTIPTASNYSPLQYAKGVKHDALTKRIEAYIKDHPSEEKK